MQTLPASVRSDPQQRTLPASCARGLATKLADLHHVGDPRRLTADAHRAGLAVQPQDGAEAHALRPADLGMGCWATAGEADSEISNLRPPPLRKSPVQAQSTPQKQSHCKPKAPTEIQLQAQGPNAEQSNCKPIAPAGEDYLRRHAGRADGRLRGRRDRGKALHHGGGRKRGG